MAEVIKDSRIDPPRLVYTEGDRLPALVATLVKVDLTSAVDVRLFWERPGDSNNLDKLFTPIDLTKGQFQFVFDAGDFIPGLGQVAQIRLTSAGSLPQVLAQIIFDVIARVTAP